MNELLPLLLAVCVGIVIVGGALIVLGLVILRRWAPRLLETLSGASAVFASGEAGAGAEMAENTRRRPRLRDRTASDPLDFDAALARHRKEDTPPAPADVRPQQVDTSQFGVNASSPITGRIMRDGRYRRVTGGTPGREQDQDFRRVEGGGPSNQADLPPAPKPNFPRRKRRDQRHQDEIFGGMLDEDGDGDVDF